MLQDALNNDIYTTGRWVSSYGTYTIDAVEFYSRIIKKIFNIYIIIFVEYFCIKSEEI